MIVFMRYFSFTSSNVRIILNIRIWPSSTCSMIHVGVTTIVGYIVFEWMFFFIILFGVFLLFEFNLESIRVILQIFVNYFIHVFISPLSRHFLFKTGTGTTPFFGTAAPGYTMATGTVYSTPARPLPRNSLSRGAFKFKKSPKHCSWKCTALIAVGIAVVLSIVLCYCIGKPKL